MSFGSSSPPPPPPAPAPPTITDPAIEAAAEAERKAALLRRGRASTILTKSGDLGNVDVQKKTLLGQ